MKSLTVPNNLTQPLDHLRIAMLRMTMKNYWLRRMYCDSANRLGLSFLLLSGIYLAISLKWSIVLLVLGPLVLGYPHLVASYRFLQKPLLPLGSQLTTQKVFRIFLFLTAASLCIRFFTTRFDSITQLPYGSWEILLSIAALGLIRIKLQTIRHWIVALLTLIVTAVILNLAWFYPMAFVGFALILHNWVAFGHWFLAAKDFKNKFVVVLATGLFALIHIFIFKGFFDSWIAFPKLSFLSTQSFEASGWVLASWTRDPLIWNRMIVIYTFGLSLHYFVWLKAIPQCLDQKAVPNSFRRSFEQLRQDCGEHTTIAIFIVAVIALSLFLFTSVAGPIYFGLAMLHGWLEFTFLNVAIFSKVVNISRSV